VPEVAVDEDGKLRPSEHYVGAARQFLGVFHETDASPSQLREHRLLRASVLALDARHELTAFLRRHDIALMRADDRGVSGGP
jgi:hypothetical protein